ncbi:phospholipase D-like domain-containing protein [Sulfitobacter sp. D35]|uniref:phospholipase D-like domain-containing protein n=1 Tax=Sulfitobacter sp. D35 TaxID=3083252 RepID=UPI00296F34B3|nr:phospholipase D-like domain-containing protein [Sulfitobacter sp. D35]MDW4499445.1 phospholipase D-like domain-containing protein [Sulfitobacter sp. D35]
MSITFIALIATAGVAALVAVLLLQQRRTPQSTLAWLMAVILLPHIAVPLFLLLGFRKRGSGFRPIRYTKPSETSAAAGPLDELFRRFELPGATRGNSVELLVDGITCWKRVVELVESAEHEIDVVFYVVADDEVGQHFVDLLTERAAAGVRVRMMVDWLGGFRGPTGALRRLKRAGGEIRYFSPLLHMPERGHVNLRNHRKLIMVDGTRVFAGGRNIGAYYMGPERRQDRWIDLSFVLEGPAVLSFADVFKSDWSMGRKNDERPKLDVHVDRVGDSVVQLVPSGPDSRFDPLHDALVNAIHSAQRRVWIATPYFIPTEHLENALATASRKGRDVRILMPRKSNQWSADIARGPYIRSLQSAGARLLFVEDGMMHAKMGVIDDTAWVGSANFDVRSMLLNFESTLVIYDPPGVEELARWFREMQAHCSEGVARVGVMRRAVEGLFRLGAPVL